MSPCRLGQVAARDAALVELSEKPEATDDVELYLPEPYWLDAADRPGARDRLSNPPGTAKSAVDRLLANL
jgi:hypothetical protein